MRVLLVEDQPTLAQHVCEGLVADGYVVDMAADGNEALRLAAASPYDILLLDVMTPGKDGFTVLRELRAQNILTPVIFITGRDQVEDRVAGLDAGGDDYITKPFSLSELLARVRALLRRQRPQAPGVLRVADLELDLISRCVTRAGAKVQLTGREFAVLEILMASAPNPVSKGAIMQHVWQQAADARTNVVNVYMKHLRRKIDRPGLTPLLHTVRGVGFALRNGHL
jgi:two-component system copper resistance phosphate regulon response regulator CusR